MFTIAYKSFGNKTPSISYVLREEALQLSIKRPKSTKRGTTHLDSFYIENTNPRRFFIAGSYCAPVPSCCEVKNHNGKPMPKVYTTLKLRRESSAWDWSVRFELPTVIDRPRNVHDTIIAMQQINFATSNFPSMRLGI